MASSGSEPVLSDDGRWVAYARSGTIRRWDRASGATTVVSSGQAAAARPSISDDGSRLAWHEATGGLGRVAVLVDGHVQTRSGNEPVLAGDGRYLHFENADSIALRRWDLSDGSETGSGVRADAVSDDGDWSVGVTNGSSIGMNEVGAHQFSEGAGYFSGPIGVAPSEPIVTGDGPVVFFSANPPRNDFIAPGDVAGHYQVYRWDIARSLDLVAVTGVPIDTSDDGSLLLTYDRRAGSYHLNDLTPLPPAPTPAQMRSPQLTDQIARLYLAYFGRPADAAGSDYWRNRRADGVSLTTISALFASSPEFAARYGTSDNAAFVALVYSNVLGRTPDPAGLEFWVSRLSSGLSRGAMMTNFSESPEFIGTTGTSLPSDPRAAQVWRLYRAYFQRDADAAGLEFWYHELLARRTLNEISNSFAGSTEFGSIYGARSHREFVTLVYVNVLGRAPDAAGLEFWVSRLSSGLSRGAMMTNFSESPEFIVATNSLPTSS